MQNAKTIFFTYSFCAIFILFFQTISAQNLEYETKGVFFKKFANYITWPPQHTNDEFIITIIGKTKFDETLEKLYENKKIINKKVKIIFISDPKKIESCNILFICKSEQHRLSNILDIANEKKILTFSDTKGFGEKGVHINYYFSPTNQIYFELNLEETKKQGFKIDFLLVDIAKVIKTK